jgi:hypothetical protein
MASLWSQAPKRRRYFFCVETALYGRIVFGASAVLLGVIALMWYDSDTGKLCVKIRT